MIRKIKGYQWILLIAVASFAYFQWFSVTTSSENKSRLDSIKDIHFPVLETLDQNIVRLDKIRDLFLQSVMIAESSLIDEARLLVEQTNTNLKELIEIAPGLEKGVDKVLFLLDDYSRISSKVALEIIENGSDSDKVTSSVGLMNASLHDLQNEIRAFRNDSYHNFIITLSESEKSASNLHLLGILLGLMNLCFVGILGYFVAMNNRMMNVIEEQNATLELRVAERTVELEAAQGELIKAEKMAALGGLVSGVAHEINTPVGISVTASSSLADEIRFFRKQLDEGQLKKSTLNHFLDYADESTAILEKNLFRASELIKSFKQVAVDQSIEQIRTINLNEYFNEVLSSLRPKWKHTQIEVLTDFPENIDITTYPGALAQILTNLISNSMKHGFEDGTLIGEIKIGLKSQDDKVIFNYEDTGKGMDESTLSQIFDPFFTTKRGSGGTGLGMHIVYNLVTQKLKGNIQCKSQPGTGCHMIISLPRVLANLKTQLA